MRSLFPLIAMKHVIIALIALAATWEQDGRGIDVGDQRGDSILVR